MCQLNICYKQCGQHAIPSLVLSGISNPIFNVSVSGRVVKRHYKWQNVQTSREQLKPSGSLMQVGPVIKAAIEHLLASRVTYDIHQYEVHMRFQISIF